MGSAMWRTATTWKRLWPPGSTSLASMSALPVAAPPRRKSARISTGNSSRSTACTSGLGSWAHSHGGLIAYGWAFRHPVCVDRIAGMCPATDFRTYPTLPNVVHRSDEGTGLWPVARGARSTRPANSTLSKTLLLWRRPERGSCTFMATRIRWCPRAPTRRSLHAATRELGGEAEIVLLKALGAGRANSRGHDGPELYESAQLLKFLLAD